MPLLRAYQSALPAWCELESFEIIRLPAGSSRTLIRRGRKEKIIVAEGECHIRFGAQERAASEGENLDLPEGDARFVISDVVQETVLVWFSGRWGEETGGSGLFSVENVTDPHDEGDPSVYEKETSFDNHYHDCDEYWVVLRGEATVVSEGKTYQVKPGDCIATGKGHHHDFLGAHSPIKAVYFETTLEGQKRRGHLWDHTHGVAVPDPKRI